ncbi:leucine rich repeat variant [Tolypothrix tenuis PCC 7101]|uniref:Leucine rich repeat variant n=2 Tax=Tolypothrix TaxID=111782 RepID=A0A1Z4N8A9_9CYAN|nr:hypothetical protein [Aulosira sp. FACHB-113]BAZ01968.1 leucine rich repeat variant [Tolypothrix tenuis PCC 7101]BAZ74108.1 leucine rich repeat variant [Aulosira laxa NIES-50]
MQPLQPVSVADLQAFLDTPEQLLQQSPQLQLAVASYIETPRSLLEVLANSTDTQVSQAASLHVNYAGEITENWQQVVDTILQQQQLGQNDRLAVELLKLGTVPPCFFSEWVPAEKLIPALRNPHMPLKYRLQLLERLAQEPTLEPRLQVAESPETPLAVLEQLAGDLELPIRLAVKFNPSCPPSLIELVEGQHTVASDWNTDAEQLTMLGQSRWPWIRLAVAQNPSATAETLMQLAGDGVYKIQLAISQNPLAPTQALNLLVNHYYDEIQTALAKHPKTSEEALLKLYPKHKHTIITQRKNLPLSIIDQLVRDRSDKNFYYYVNSVINQPNTSGEILELLANDSLESMRVKVAKHPQVLVSTLKQLAKDSSSEVREAVISHPKTPKAVKKSLLSKNQTNYVYRISSGFKPKDQQQKLEQQSQDPNTSPHILAELAKSSDSIIRCYVGKNSSTPLEALIELMKDSNLQVRECVLRNINIPYLEEHQRIMIEEEYKQMILGRYRLLLSQLDTEEITNAHQLMARRTDSPYALAQVLEKGDRNSKLTAARSNKTPIQVLQQLAKDADEAVRQAVSQNANLPLHNLLELARDPSVNVRSNLAYKPSHSKTPTPIQLLEILAQDESERIRARVAEHPNTPVEILVRLANDSSREVKTKLIANPNTPTTILNRLGLEENLVNQRNPNTPGIVLAQAVKSMSGKNLADFIKHPVKGSQMPAETLAQLATHTDSSVRYRVASHPNTPATVLRQLARDSYVATVRAVASNPNTSPETLEVLASHPDFTTRLDVVRNPNTPPRALSQIVQSTQNSGNTPNQTVDMLKSAFPGNHNDVLRSIAGNPHTPIEALEILARREFVGATPDPQALIPPTTDDEIVRSLAYNPSLTPQLLAILTHDPSIEVRVCLVRHPNLTEALWLRLAEDTAISVREAVAAANNAPVSVLELLARDEQSEVRIKVATNSNTLIPVLELLARDENPSVRTAAASNPHLPESILTQLASDEKVEVRRAVAQNPNTPAAIKQTLRDLLVQPNTQQATSTTLRGISRIYNPSSDDITTILAEYANSDNAFVRLVTLLHPLTPPEILTQATQSASWLERYAVADNPATPRELRQQLTQDSNRVVRVAAKV